jgi:PAS domain S-box-containing protein
MNLATKITLAIFTLSIGVAIATGVAVFVFTKDTLQDTIAIEQEMTIEGVMRAIDRTLYERVLDIQSIAVNDIIESELSQVAADGHEETHAKVVAELAELTLVTGPWDILELQDRNGTVTHSTLIAEHKEEEHERDRLENQVYLEAIKGDMYVSDAAISHDTGKPTVVFAAPVYDTSNPARPIVGAVIGHFAWPVVVEILESVGYDARLYNGEGVLIGTSLYEERADILARSDKEHATIKAALNGDTGSVIGKNIGNTKNVLTSFTPQKGFLTYSGSGWTLVVDAPQEVILAPAKEKGLAVAGITMGLIALLALATVVLMRVLVTRPLGLFLGVLDSIKSGEVTKRVLLRSNDEIGTLAKGFNAMMDRIAKEEGVRQNIIDVLPGSLFLVDEKGNIERVNPSAEAMLGYGKEELVGESIKKVFYTTTTTTTTTTTVFHLIGLDELVSIGSMKNRAIDMIAKNGQNVPVMLYGRMIGGGQKDKKGAQGAERAVLVALDRRKEKIYVEKRLSTIIPVLQNAAVGDFSKTFPISDQEDEFTELLVALNLMMGDIQEAQEAEQKRYKELVNRTRDLELKTEVLQDTKKALSKTFDSLDEEQARMKQADTTLKAKVSELERFNNVMVDRELKMVELKKELQAIQGLTNKKKKT